MSHGKSKKNFKIFGAEEFIDTVSFPIYQFNFSSIGVNFAILRITDQYWRFEL